MQLFIGVFISQLTVVAALAGCHGDTDTDGRPRQNCTAAGFSHVPAGLEPSTKVGAVSGVRWAWDLVQDRLRVQVQV